MLGAEQGGSPLTTSSPPLPPHSRRSLESNPHGRPFTTTLRQWMARFLFIKQRSRVKNSDKKKEEPHGSMRRETETGGLLEPPIRANEESTEKNTTQERGAKNARLMRFIGFPCASDKFQLSITG